MKKTLYDALNEINSKLGTTLSEICPDGKYHRFDVGLKKNKAGWYIGKLWHYNGQEYFAITFGAWNQGNEPHKILSWDKSDETLNSDFKKELSLLNDKLKKEEEKIQAERYQKIMDNLKTFTLLKSEENDYLKKKKVKTFSGLYEDQNKTLVVPIYSDFLKEKCGYQKVFTTHKAFPVGQKVKGNFFILGDVFTGSFVYLCEGIATALTIFETTGVPTISCFNAGNIPNVAKRIKHELVGKHIIIACDNDKAGIKFALKAKRELGNIKVIKPDFGNTETTLTDFNDLFVLSGPEETKRQLAFDENDFVTIDFLGFNESTYYFYSSRKKGISKFSFEKIRAGQLCEIAKENYWSQKFVCNYDKEGIPLETCNWRKTSELIAEKQQAIGFFDPSNIKGLGSWVENGKLVLNLGDKILVEGKESGFGRALKTKTFYSPSMNKIDYKENPSEDFSAISKALDLVDFDSERDKIYTLGYIGFAQIFSLQKWKPHLWINAEKGSGKSSLLSFINSLVQNSVVLQDSTAAGIRQLIKFDSKVCLIDEAEGESYRTKQVLELARESSSGSGSTVVRGSPGGDVVSYKPELSFVFASIRLPDITPADESRIVQVFLSKPKEHDPLKNQKRISAFYDAERFGVDVFSFVNKNIELFNSIKKEFHRAILEAGFDPRFADQHSPLLAGYMILNQEDDPQRVLEVALSEPYAETVNLVEKDSDHEDFRDCFLQTTLRLGQADYSLEQAMVDFLQSTSELSKNFLQRELARHGVFYRKRKKCFCFIKNNNLKNIVSKNSIYKNYWKSFINNKYFCRSTVTIKGKEHGCFELSFELSEETTEAF